MDNCNIKTKKEVAAVFKRWREKSGLSLSQFATALGLSIPSYSYIEAGKVYPSFPAISQLSRKGFDLNKLFTLSVEEAIDRNNKPKKKGGFCGS